MMEPSQAQTITMTLPNRPISGSVVMVLVVATILASTTVTSMKRTVPVDGGPAGNVWPDMRVNLNVAEPAELSVLPGLGPSLAQRIVDDRLHNGPFLSVDDLDRVSGIGPSIVERLRLLAVVE